MPEHDGKITFYVIVCVIIAAFGGMLFGYDIGISGRGNLFDLKEKLIVSHFCLWYGLV